jgi:parvulin-like peptidyl-prolyl isomerase
MRKLLILIAALIFVVSCSKGSSTKGNVVAKVGNKTITQEELQAEIKALPAEAKAFFQGPEGTARFVDEIINKEMLYLEAQKRGLDKNKEFQKQVEEFKKLTLINQLLQKEIESASKVSDKDIKEYYDKHKDEFTINNQVRLSQIVVKTDEEVKKVYERIQKGEDFAKIASEMSHDKTSAKSGGDIGVFKKGEMIPELENVAFNLKKGSVSMPVKLKDRIHILKVTDAKGNVIEFEKVKNMIAQRVMVEKQREAFDKLLANLKKNYKIEKNKEAIAKLNLLPEKPHPQMQIPQMQ